jgi:glycosyltransferase involved in cell wall biosynthesis
MSIPNQDSQLITVITVVRNGENDIERTIQSVLKAKEKHNIDFIIIDGQSVDKTVEIICRYKSNISFWVSEADQGIYDAMNKGWKIAKESYILYLGAGDEIISLPQDFPLFRGENFVYYGNVLIGNKLYSSKHGFMIKVGNTLHHQALLIYKTVSISEPFNTQYKIYADYDFNARLFKENIKFIRLNEFESYAMPGGISSAIHLKEMLTIIKSNFGTIWTIFARIYHLIQGLKYGFHKYKLK